MHKNAAMSNLDGEFLAAIVLTNPNLQASSLRAKRGISLRSKPRATDRALTTHTPTQTANLFSITRIIKTSISPSQTKKTKSSHHKYRENHRQA
jgi:hypothetical protein